jgi:hypothetical protein
MAPSFLICNAVSKMQPVSSTTIYNIVSETNSSCASISNNPKASYLATAMARLAALPSNLQTAGLNVCLNNLTCP